MKNATIVLAVFLAIAAPAATYADPTGGYIKVRVVNSHGDDHPVEMVDNICKRVVFSKRIVGHATLDAQVCSYDMGKGDVTLRNLQSGARQHYRGFIDNAKLEVP
jgi:hypothetical protein